MYSTERRRETKTKKQSPLCHVDILFWYNFSKPIQASAIQHSDVLAAARTCSPYITRIMIPCLGLIIWLLLFFFVFGIFPYVKSSTTATLMKNYNSSSCFEPRCSLCVFCGGLAHLWHCYVFHSHYKHFLMLHTQSQHVDAMLYARCGALGRFIYSYAIQQDSNKNSSR